MKLRAIGFKDDIPTEYRPDPKFFKPIPVPTHEDDWLAQYAPDKQNFLSWKKFASRRRFLSSSNRKLYLQPLGKFASDSAPSLSALQEYCAAFYDPFPVELLNHLEISEDHNGTFYLQTDPSTNLPLTSRHCHKYYTEEASESHRQFRVDKILQYLDSCVPEDALCLVAITMEDLYDGNSDAFTVGMAWGGNRVAVFSFARYNPHFSDLYLRQSRDHQKDIRYTKEDQKLLLLRSCKVMVHEIGHILCIEHCSFWSCIMNGSGHLEEDYRQSIHLCPVDLRKVTTLTETPVEKLYAKLLAFYHKYECHEEANWIEERLLSIRIQKEEDSLVILSSRPKRRRLSEQH
eukprot:TRINITY_DN10394_c0_g1_i1.p1 TRINITY_DN10394_c0_g1~~TRINITY_DN10394_c0_g1_i1.p1  ORF type:complete len:376 (+),score=56.39 TRINITY_DN10394_c0_g1_i1:93-1130(+)